MLKVRLNVNKPLNGDDKNKIKKLPKKETALAWAKKKQKYRSSKKQEKVW